MSYGQQVKQCTFGTRAQQGRCGVRVDKLVRDGAGGLARGSDFVVTPFRRLGATSQPWRTRSTKRKKKRARVQYHAFLATEKDTQTQP